METFKVELTQVNKSGELTFQAIANSIKSSDEIKLSLELADFCKSTIETSNKLAKLGVKGLSKARIKSSQPLNVKISSIIDDTSLSFELGNFGKLASESSQAELKEIFSTVIEHNSKFAHLWS